MSTLKKKEREKKREIYFYTIHFVPTVKCKIGPDGKKADDVDNIEFSNAYIIYRITSKTVLCSWKIGLVKHCRVLCRVSKMNLLP